MLIRHKVCLKTMTFVMKDDDDLEDVNDIEFTTDLLF